MFYKSLGPVWERTYGCYKIGKRAGNCIMKYIPQRCKNAFHRVTKVLRFSVDLFEYLLNERDDIKVIHLFRDPRAIINSRLKTDWYKTPRNISLNAQSLCHKMLHDFNEGARLLKRYPSKFMFLYYEDLNEKAFSKVNALYRYIGMDTDPAKYESIKNLSVFSEDIENTGRVGNTAFWWRNTLKWDIVQQVDRQCSEVYKLLGFSTFEREQDLRDLNIPSLTIPSAFKLIKSK